MGDIVSKLRDMTLKSKLIISFIGLIVVPSIVLGFSIRLYSRTIQDVVIKSAIQSNDQVIKNLDAFLDMLSKLSEYPIKDSTLRNLLVKDYMTVQNAEYEKGQDFSTAKELLYNNVKSFSDMIDSVLLYQAGTFDIRGRTPTDSLKMSYTPSGEAWVDKILKAGGACAVIGIHTDRQQGRGSDYVVSVGRSIIDLGTRKSQGFVIINVKTENLEKLWMDTKLTENSKFFLVDENDRVIFSKDRSEVNTNIVEITGKRPDSGVSSCILTDQEGGKAYMISSISRLSGWKVINIIPRDELMLYFDRMFNINMFVTIIAIIFSIIVAILIATGVTRPLYRLNQKMKLVGRGSFDVEIEPASGEVGEISLTVRKMISEIRRLINEIYKEEEEKRVVEMLALQSQINPHFLYNTLNTIKWMASIQGADSIESALNSLSSLFAFTVRTRGDYASIEEEMKFVEDYLAILNLRYYNRFSVTFDIEQEVYRYKTLKFLLQPVIENAVFHGIEGVDRKGLLLIRIHRVQDTIAFEVEDNGKGIDEERLRTIFVEEDLDSRNKFNSIGIPNIQKRIKLHFGEGYGVSIRSEVEKGTRVTITIPAMPLDIDERER